MRHLVSKKQLGRGRGHRRSMVRNLMTSLFLHGRIQTTEIKAKALRKYIEPLITATRKQDTMNAIRYLKKYLFTEAASRKALALIKGYAATKTSGYTRISPVKTRKGDNAKIFLIELL